MTPDSSNSNKWPPVNLFECLKIIFGQIQNNFGAFLSKVRGRKS